MQLLPMKFQSGSSGPGKGVLFFLFGSKDFRAPIISLVLETKIKLPRKITMATARTVVVSVSSSRLPIVNPAISRLPKRIDLALAEP